MTDHYGHKQLLKGLNHICIGVTSIVKTISLTVLQSAKAYTRSDHQLKSGCKADLHRNLLKVDWTLQSKN